MRINKNTTFADLMGKTKFGEKLCNALAVKFNKEQIKTIQTLKILDVLDVNNSAKSITCQTILDCLAELLNIDVIFKDEINNARKARKDISDATELPPEFIMFDVAPADYLLAYKIKDGMEIRDFEELPKKQNLKKATQYKDVYFKFSNRHKIILKLPKLHFVK